MDLIIDSATLADGSGGPASQATVGIVAGRIEAIGDLDGVDAGRRIDARGFLVCPGFVDPHSHAELALLTGREMPGRLAQGITTEVVGQDGLSFAPADPTNLQDWRRYLRCLYGDGPDEMWSWRSVGDFVASLDGRASNAVYLVPHGALRVEVMGWAPRPATGDELAAMAGLLRRGLDEGAAGLSTGLNYVPCSHATTDEMVALCRVVARAGGVYVTHLRSYGAQVLAAIDEAIDIGRRSGVAVHISHLRVADPSNHGLAPAMLERIDRARAGGVDVTFDLYPYTWGCAPLLVVLPPWAQEGGPAPILERLGDPATVARMDAEMSAAGIDWSACNVSNLPPLPCGDWDGASLPQVAAALGLPPSRAVLRLLLESELDATFVAGGGSEEDNALLLAHPAAMIGSDGVLVGRHPHPRGYGCFPRVLARCVRESRLMSWEAAIAKMTALPAARFGLEDRGRLRASAAADLVVLSPERVADTATFEEGRRPPGGIEWVVLNGQVVVQNGTYTGGNYGRALRPLQSNWRHADASS
ncbi:MAG: D-aminoacylase [Anaerolineae bacterium]|nr:D-aminoacylase [Anaerolineae bacterium]